MLSAAIRLGLLFTLVAVTGCTQPPTSPPAGPSEVAASPSPVATTNLASLLAIVPGRELTYEVTTIRKGKRQTAGRTTYRVTTVVNDEDFMGDYRVTTAAGKVYGDDNVAFTRPNGIFYAGYSPLHPTLAAYTDTETLTTSLGPIETLRTTASQVRPEAKTTDRFTYWIHERILIRQHLDSESDGEEITELVAVK